MEDIRAVKPFRPIRPTIYCYSTPGVSYHDGWVKIGYTERQTAEDRVAQQTNTAGIRAKIEWQEAAHFKGVSGGWFTDREFHRYLTVEREVERELGTEWFHLAAGTALDHFNDFAGRKHDYKKDGHSEYTLREEQLRAVAMTQAYFESEEEDTGFLWNAKPRFGKTLSAYDLILRMGFRKVLVVTNRPSIANSWADDFTTFVRWRGGLLFVSELDSMRSKKGVLTRAEYLRAISAARQSGEPAPGFIEFESLQNLKGSVYFGGDIDKLEWLCAERVDGNGNTIQGLTFDLLIVDEAHEGVETVRTDTAFKNIARKHTLYLSGTPFKALAGGLFSSEQIFNWTYADEQEAKASWSGESGNPYEPLPRMAMFTYRLSPMILERVERGLELPDGDTARYAFDLNEFFATKESGGFLREEEVKKFLHALSTQEKYPFSTPELRGELAHTLWILNRVASAKALAKMLRADPVFKEYEIVLAAGDGRLDGEDSEKARETAFNRVKKAIAGHEKTITLSVGQLTVGVTVPEWSGVLMLCNMQSAASYIQAAFRAQNPCVFSRAGAGGKPELLRKETAYVFDFDPARTLVIFDQFANSLAPDTAAGRGSSGERLENIRKLLNFFPVIGEDDEGRMTELDAARVLSLPRRIVSEEVVRRGFMSNLLFQNISGVFSAPAAVRTIIEKIHPSPRERSGRGGGRDGLAGIGRVPVDGKGTVCVPGEPSVEQVESVFGPKIYEVVETEIKPALERALSADPENGEAARKLADALKETGKRVIVAQAAAARGLSKAATVRAERELCGEIEKKIQNIQSVFIQRKKIAAAKWEKACAEAETPEEASVAEEVYNQAMAGAQAAFEDGLRETAREFAAEAPASVLRLLEKEKAERAKKDVQDAVMDCLRGFSRSIPSFIMAYGDENLTLANFDKYTEDDVFLEVTGITEADFRFLRDGGEYVDKESGKRENYKGQLFNETVFNDSVRMFLEKRKKLANYFDESCEEDIFDYIPPQKTNQIFTPRAVVKKMVDALEAENPGCFDDPSATFADLYMKSGLYITEIVKRLYRSRGLKAAYPDDKERVRHILREQVFGMAPTRIIYLIATKYIFGFDETLQSETKHFVQADAAQAAKEGRLRELVDDCFGKK